MNIDQIAMCYTSMDSSQRALQTNEKLFFSTFKLVFEFVAKYRKIFKRIERCVNIDQIAMCYTSMDSSQRALQTNEKLFFKFQISF